MKVQLKGTSLGSNNVTVRAESAPSSDACGGDSISDAVAKDAIRKPIIVEVSIAYFFFLVSFVLYYWISLLLEVE